MLRHACDALVTVVRVHQQNHQVQRKPKVQEDELVVTVLAQGDDAYNNNNDNDNSINEVHEIVPISNKKKYYSYFNHQFDISGILCPSSATF